MSNICLFQTEDENKNTTRFGSNSKFILKQHSYYNYNSFHQNDQHQVDDVIIGPQSELMTKRCIKNNNRLFS